MHGRWPRRGVLCFAGDVLRDMGLRDAFNVQLSVPALNGDAVATVLRALDCFSSGEVLQVRRSACPCVIHTLTVARLRATQLSSR